MKRLEELTEAELLELVRADPKGASQFQRDLTRACQVLAPFILIAADLGLSHAVVEAALGEMLARDVAGLSVSDADRAALLENWFAIVRERVAFKVQQRRDAEIAEAMQMPRH